MNWLRRRFGPRCAQPAPWRLADAGPCTLRRGHQAQWHDDGNGYRWNATHWFWSGPPLDLSEDRAEEWTQ